MRSTRDSMDSWDPVGAGSPLLLALPGAGSTCEAEYIAALEAANEGVWMKEFISDLGVCYVLSLRWFSLKRKW